MIQNKDQRPIDTVSKIVDFIEGTIMGVGLFLLFFIGSAFQGATFFL